MRIEIPDCVRCCGFLPLRYGIIIFGYLNLGFNILMLSVEVWYIVVYEAEYGLSSSMQAMSNYLYRGVGFFTQTWFIFVLYALEIIFNAVLLFGAHTKRTKILRAYYYYGITTTLAAFASYLFARKVPDYERSFDFYIMEFCIAFCGMVLQVYLLLLIRSELKKLDSKKQNCFVNHASEVYAEPHDDDGRNPL